MFLVFLMFLMNLIFSGLFILGSLTGNNDLSCGGANDLSSAAGVMVLLETDNGDSGIGPLGIALCRVIGWFVLLCACCGMTCGPPALGRTCGPLF